MDKSTPWSRVLLEERTVARKASYHESVWGSGSIVSGQLHAPAALLSAY
jgi:hypothetical protein